MEKTLEMHIKELREQIAQEIESCIDVDSAADDAARHKARAFAIAADIARGQNGD
jgi:hypothetical protein